MNPCHVQDLIRSDEEARTNSNGVQTPSAWRCQPTRERARGTDVEERPPSRVTAENPLATLGQLERYSPETASTTTRASTRLPERSIVFRRAEVPRERGEEHA